MKHSCLRTKINSKHPPLLYTHKHKGGTFILIFFFQIGFRFNQNTEALLFSVYSSLRMLRYKVFMCLFNVKVQRNACKKCHSDVVIINILYTNSVLITSCIQLQYFEVKHILRLLITLKNTTKVKEIIQSKHFLKGTAL